MDAQEEIGKYFLKNLHVYCEKHEKILDKIQSIPFSQMIGALKDIHKVR